MSLQSFRTNGSIFLVSRSLCLKFTKTMITEDAILNFIGNWFQCFPVYPGLNLSSGSGSGSVSGSGSGFRLPVFPYAHVKSSRRLVLGIGNLLGHFPTTFTSFKMDFYFRVIFPCEPRASNLHA